MCGIVGLINADPARDVPRALIERMCAAILHRGPDDEGIFLEGAAGLGMRRLSIIDLAGGHQPIFNEDGSKVIVFNGEIYNYRTLRDELRRAGHELRSSSDTETVLHLFEDLGPACLDRLRGMFAFAIWDRASRELFLARDRFGIKPLYIAASGTRIAFASELKALLAVGLTERNLDWDAIDCYLQLGYIPAPLTPFADVRKLEPGHAVRWRAGAELEPFQYWDLPAQERGRPAPSGQAVLELIDDSVAAHLESDVPVAAFLSGGLDSSAVVASMAARGSPPHVFTARYHGSGGPEVDESGLAASLARRCGARLSVIDIHPDLREIFEPIVESLDEPHADDSAVPTWLISQAVAGEYKVALTGIGGDELFAGYRRHQGMVLGGLYSRLPAAARAGIAAAAGLLREPKGSGLGVNRLKRFLAAGAGGVEQRYLDYLTRITTRELQGLYSPGLGGRAVGATLSRRFESLYRRRDRPTSLSTALYLDYKTFLADDILALSDRLSMAHSLEIRVPLVDHVVVERIFPLADRLKLGLRGGKPLLRRALRSRLPAGHFRAPKRGFVGPTAAWLRNELWPVLMDELSPDRMTRLGYFDPGVVSRLMREHADRRRNWEGVLWALLCFSTWHRIFLEGPAVRPPR
jgi:asparagine synthase (glutamine-hydrolysing)